MTAPPANPRAAAPPRGGRPRSDRHRTNISEGQQRRQPGHSKKRCGNKTHNTHTITKRNDHALPTSGPVVAPAASCLPPPPACLYAVAARSAASPAPAPAPATPAALLRPAVPFRTRTSAASPAPPPIRASSSPTAFAGRGNRRRRFSLLLLQRTTWAAVVLKLLASWTCCKPAEVAVCSSVANPATFCADMGSSSLVDNACDTQCAGATCVQSTDAATCCKRDTRQFCILESPTSCHGKWHGMVQKIGAENPFDGVDGGLNAAPAAMDADGDGDSDMYIGNYDGRIHYYENTGNETHPKFTQRTGAGNNPLHGVVVEKRAKPRPVDADGDGDLDMYIEFRAGDRDQLLYYENTGSAIHPNYTRRTDAGDNRVRPAYIGIAWGEIRRPGYDEGLNPFNGVRFTVQYPTPRVVDVDGDGDMDMYVGLVNGEIWFYENTGSTTNPAFTRRMGAGNNPFNGVDVGSQAVPASVDIDGDGDLDMFVGTGDGEIWYFENTRTSSLAYTQRNGAGNDPLHIHLVTGNPGQMNRASPVAVDADGDGDQDLYVGKWGGGVQSISTRTRGAPTTLCTRGSGESATIR